MLLTMMATTGEIWGQTTETLNVANYASANNWANQTQYLTATVGNVTFTATGGGNTGKYYTSDNTWRFYANESATLTIAVPSGSTIQTVTPTFTTKDNGTLLYGSSACTSGSAVNINSESAVFTISQSSGNKGKIFFTEIAVTYTTGGSSDPSITANDVNIDYDATNGSIAYTLNNATGNVDAEVTTGGDWLTLGTITATEVPFTCSANTLNTARTATVTLSFEEADDKVVTVTQGAAPVVYTTIPALFEAATDNATDVTIIFDSWVISAVKNSNAYLTDNQGNGLIIYASEHGFQVNDVLTGTASCKLQLYRGSAELTILTSSTEGLSVTHNGTVTEQNIAINNLGGVNTGALLTYENLTYNGTALVDANDNTITPYSTLYSYTFVNGKAYNVKGIYLQYNNTKELLPRSADDIEEVETEVATPTFSPAAGTYAEAQTVTMSCTTEGAAIHYTTDGTEPDGNSNVYSTGITVSETTTFKAKAIKGNDASNVVTATYHICSADAPYTVAQALEFLEYPTSTIWVNGIVSTAPTSLLSGGLLTYSISDNGEAENQLLVYKGKNINNEAFTSVDDIQVGDIVTITGIVKDYQGTLEFDNGNYLTSFERPTPPIEPSITVNSTLVEATAAETEGSLTVTYTAIETDLGVEIHWFETSTSTEPLSAAPEWIDADFSTTSIETIDYVIEANTGAVRTAYFKVYGMDADANDVYSDLVTVTQAAAPQNYSLTVEPFENLELITFVDDQMELEGDGNIQVTSGAQVMLSVVADEGYVIETLMVNGVDHANDIEANHTYSFEMPSENVTISATAVEYIPPVGGNYIRINDISYLTDGAKVIIAARYNEDNTDGYYAMQNTLTSGKSTGVQFTSQTSNNNEILPSSIVDDEDDYYWIVNETENGYSFTNANGDLIGYGNNGTNLVMNGTKTEWTVVLGTSDEAALVGEYTGFVMKNYTTDTRACAYSNTGVFGAYATSNMTGNNAPSYNFYLDFFVQGAEPVVTPSITINPGPYNMNCDGGHTVLDVAYANMAQDPQLEVIFYESDGTTAATYNHDWIDAHIDNDGNLDGTIQLNTTNEARSAYFKIKGVGNNSELVYSDLVTINQAAYVLSITFGTTELNIEVGGESDRKISFDYSGLGSTPTFTINYYESDGTTAATYNHDWLTATISGNKVKITVTANTGAARSAYFKVYGTGSFANTESNLVTINQAKYVAPTYTVTYDANGGLGTMTDPNSPYVENDEVTLLENTFTAPEGKKWDSWLVQDANQTEIEVNEGKFNMPASDVTVSAQWVVDPDVPTYEWVLTALEDLTENDIFVIVGTRTDDNYAGNYAMSNNKGTTSAPAAISVEITNNKLSEAPDNIKWNLTGNATDGYTFYPNGNSDKWLYCTTNNSNDRLRVGTNTNNIFNLDSESGYLKYSNYYIGLYNAQDWRGYTNNTGNIANQTFGFYKRQEASTDPQLYANDVNIDSDATEGEITYTLVNPVSGGILTAEITEGDWLTLGTVGENNVPFTCSANTEQTERTATVTLTYSYGENSIHATAVVTQAALIIDYATLPFAFDGGRADIEDVNGLTQDGLDSDYGSSPKLKFNSTNDWMILKLNKAPKSLSYDIKGNSFQDGSIFTVQTSADGNDYTDLATYTTLGDVQSITHVDLDADVRYIKWIYTNKKTGNVALGNIHATEHYDTYGDVTFNSLDLTNSSESLIVHSGSVVTVTGALVNNSADKLLVKDGGQLILPTSSKATAEVYATVEKDIVAASEWGSNTTADNWYTISSPMFSELTATDVTGLITTGEGYDYDLYRYDEANNYWRNYKQNNFAIEPSRGYLYASQHGTTISYAGIINDDDVNCPVTKTADGFNLIGNPFTQNITMENIDGATLAGGYILQKAGNWKSDVDLTVAPCQGFLVQVQESTELTISRTASNSKSRTSRDYIAFTVANSQYEDVTYALFADATGLNKINHLNSEIPMVYIPQNGQNYAIATMDDNIQAFNLNFKAMTMGQYTLSFNTQGNYSYLHVIDRLTGEDVNLLAEGEYSFIGSPADNESRFIVKLDYNANIDEIEVNDTFAYQSGSDIIVNGNGELQVFDLMGRRVMTVNVNGVQTINVNANGVYIFKMNEKTQKIVVR